MFCLTVLQANQLKNRADDIAFIFRKVCFLTVQALKSVIVLWIVEKRRSSTKKNAKNQRLSLFREN